MSKIYCADVMCKFNNDKGVCTAKTVALAWSSVVTVWDGRQEYQKCKTRENMEIPKHIQEFVKKYGLNQKGEKNETENDVESLF